MVGCLLLAGCGKPQADDVATAVPEVTVTTVRKAPLDQELLVSGNLAALPNRDAKVAALVPGRIQAVLVPKRPSLRRARIWRTPGLRQPETRACCNGASPRVRKWKTRAPKFR